MAPENVGTSPAKRASRLPTVSASQALSEALAPSSRLLSTGLPSLDRALQDASTGDEHALIGLSAGRVAEIYGPPGAGKTTICVQIAADCLSRQRSVVWIDAASQLVPCRLRAIVDCKLKASREGAQESAAATENALTRFRHYRTSSLAHFLALLLHTADSFPPENTGLVVIDSLATLIDTAYPRTAESRSTSSASRLATDRSAGAPMASRRQAIVSRIASQLTVLAAQLRIPVVVTNGVVTRVSAVGGAFLRPALTGREWDDVLWARVVLFRDWATTRHDGQGQALRPPSRFARVLKTNGRIWPANKVSASTVAFDVETHGVAELPTVSIDQAEPYMLRSGEKRPFEAIDGNASKLDGDNESEGANSENDYGWTEDDVPLAGEGLVDEAALAENP